MLCELKNLLKRTKRIVHPKRVLLCESEMIVRRYENRNHIGAFFLVVGESVAPSLHVSVSATPAIIFPLSASLGSCHTRSFSRCSPRHGGKRSGIWISDSLDQLLPSLLVFVH